MATLLTLFLFCCYYLKMMGMKERESSHRGISVFGYLEGMGAQPTESLKTT